MLGLRAPLMPQVEVTRKQVITALLRERFKSDGYAIEIGKCGAEYKV